MFSKKDYFQQRGTTLEILVADLATEVWQMTLNFLEKLEKIIWWSRIINFCRKMKFFFLWKCIFFSNGKKTVFNLFFQFLLPPTPSSNNQDFCPLATNRKNGIFDLHCNQMSLDSIFLAPKPFQKVNYQHSGHFSRWRARRTFLDTDSQKEMKITLIITGKHSSGNDFLVKLGVAIW